MPERNWSTKTLARQLRMYLDQTTLDADSKLSELIDALKSDIVEEEVGVDLDIWSAQPKGTKRPDPRDPQS